MGTQTINIRFIDDEALLSRLRDQAAAEKLRLERYIQQLIERMLTDWSHEHLERIADRIAEEKRREAEGR